jgi:prophage regulatory protein
MPLPCRRLLSFYAAEQAIGSARRRTNLMQNGQTELRARSDADRAERSASESLPAFHRGFRRTIRRPELRQIVPLADTTIYEMERRGDFPRRFYLTSRCVVWDLAEVEAWVEERRRASNAALIQRAPSPNVRQRKFRPVKQ